MTEAEWTDCTDPVPMLEFLPGKASERKFRLFACACCRGVWEWMTDERSRKGVESAERYADGSVGEEELGVAREGTAGAWTTVWGDGWHIYQSARAAHFACRTDVASLLRIPEEIRNAVRNSVASQWGTEGEREAVSLELRRQTSLVRDIFGNPFRPVKLDPSWHTRTVLAIAQTIYDDRDFALLPVLADALEDAGCENADVLNHCRQPGEHIRGCWVVDLVLGKE